MASGGLLKMKTLPPPLVEEMELPPFTGVKLFEGL